MKKKIIFIVPFLRGIGGIETSLINLLNNIDYNKFDVDLCVFANYIAFKNKIPKNVNVVAGSKVLEYCYVPYKKLKKNLSLFKYINMLLVKVYKRIFGMQKVIQLTLPTFKFKKYDIAISYANDAFINGVFTGGGNIIVDKCIDSNKKIGWIHNEPYRCGCDKNYYLAIYKNFDYIVNVSCVCKNMFDEIVPEFKEKSVVVYNTFDIEKIKKQSKEFIYKENKKFKIVTVSRIENNQKRIDRILDACEYMIKKGYKSFVWEIIGDGPDFDWVLNQLKSRNLNNNIVMCGKLDNPYPYILNSDIMVQSSDFEAYSMVLQESIILKTPLIVTNYPSAKECINNGKNGFLVELSSEGIANKLIDIMNNKKELQNIKEYIEKNPFTNNKALNQFYYLLN